MKKLITLILVALTCLTACFSLTACGKKSDLDRVKENNKLVVGVTIYQPMDWVDEDSGEWTGFDAELAQMFAEELGVNCQLVIITWSQKVAELDLLMQKGEAE